MDAETRTLLADLKTKLGTVDTLKNAVEQLEQQVGGIPQQIDKKLAQVRSTAWDGQGRYRGVFPNEDMARSFGLVMLAGSGLADYRWAADAIKSEFPDVAKAFSSSDAGNVIGETYSGTIVDLIAQYGTFERNALRVPMSNDTQRYSKKTGRMSAAPMAEGNAVSETKPTLVNKALVAKKWAPTSRCRRK